MIEAILTTILVWVVIWHVYKCVLGKNRVHSKLKVNDQVAIMRNGNIGAEGTITKVTWSFIQIKTKEAICTIPNSVLKDAMVLLKDAKQGR